MKKPGSVALLTLCMACVAQTVAEDPAQTDDVTPAIVAPRDEEAPATERTAVDPEVQDVAQRARSQAGEARTLQLGRACVAADFDGDGREDLFVGNPGDTSYLLRNDGMAGEVHFEAWADLLVGDLAWGGAAADYDNDGDIDLFVSIGGNEGAGHDLLFVNQLTQTGVADLVEWGRQAGITGPLGEDGQPLALASAGAVWGDLDLDGDLDLFVNTNESGRGGGGLLDSDLPNVVWLNQGDGTFIDGTEAVGLSGAIGYTRHSTLFDADNDGDLDLYENNYLERNRFWRNLKVETGALAFVDATSATADLGADIGGAVASFASAAADFNQDGWEDLLVFVRRAALGDCGEPASDPVGDAFERHHLFLNLGPDKGFIDVGDVSGLNARAALRSSPMAGDGVMGSQVGDLNGDGLPDVFIGNGSPAAGERDELFVSAELVSMSVQGRGEVWVPRFADWSSRIDFPAEVGRGLAEEAPSYPYRTHGSCISDFDGDLMPELFVANGGPAGLGAAGREPDRLFDLAYPPGNAPDVLRVTLVGDGRTVARTPVGTWVVVHTLGEDGLPHVFHQRLYGGSGFSAQNGLDLHFGLGFAKRIDRVVVRWPDGATNEVTNVELGTRLRVAR